MENIIESKQVIRQQNIIDGRKTWARQTTLLTCTTMKQNLLDICDIRKQAEKLVATIVNYVFKKTTIIGHTW
jgi:MoaA/NifB/PqqE/SkfB family radical SAM enzyme